MQAIVLGMHRSGTSALTGLLIRLGCYFGPDELHTGFGKQNPKGFWERRDLRLITNRILFSMGCDWDRVSKFDISKVSNESRQKSIRRFKLLLRDLNQHPTWVIKEPRLCLLLPLWQHLLDSPVVFYIYRDPLEVAVSLNKRNGMPLCVGIALWEFYNKNALLASSGLSRIFIEHRKLILDPKEIIGNIIKFIESNFADRHGIKFNFEDNLGDIIDIDLYRSKVPEYYIRSFLNDHHHDLIRCLKANGQDFESIKDISPQSKELFSLYDL